MSEPSEPSEPPAVEGSAPVATALDAPLPPPLSPAALLADSAALTPDVLARSLAALDTPVALAICASLVLTGASNAIDPAISSGLERAAPEVKRLEEQLGAGADPVEVLGSTDTELARCSAVLLEANSRLDTYHELSPSSQLPVEANVADCDAIEVDDPWADETDGDVPPILDDPWETSSATSARSAKSMRSTVSARPAAVVADAVELPFDLPTFIRQPLETSALALAASADTSALRLICERHPTKLYPYRLAILEALPGWMGPGEADVLSLLPGVAEDGSELPWPRAPSTPPTPAPPLLPRLPADLRMPASDLARVPAQTADALAEWYTSRVLSLDAFGLLDAQLAWVQHGAALNVPSLDALGEDLSLLSRLVYDAHLLPVQLDRWSLTAWRAASESQVIEAYLSAATAATVVGDYRRLVLPYLYVLESRAERAGRADPALVKRMLYDSILGLPLSLALPVFEASKATEPAHARLIKDDMDVARLALACLYGARQADAWPTMSAIFECLPVWELAGRDGADDRELTSTTLDSLAAYVRPTASGPPPAPRDLHLFFAPLPFASLSRALDILDVHLESGEILARWDTPVRLQYLLEITADRDGQVRLAHRMARRQAAADERRWIALWEDMRKLAGGDDALLRGAFGAVGLDELVNIYLGGLLASANFAVAGKVIKRLQPDGLFSPKMLEEAVLAASREYYERAETANMNTGDMKLAYDCLTLAPATPAVRSERALIEATSKLTTYRALAALSPAEVRHAPDRLALLGRVLATSPDAYRHPELVLGLADGLGYAGDAAARAAVLAMLVDAALGSDDFAAARARCAELVGMARAGGAAGRESSAHARVRDHAWRASLALGQRADWADAAARRDALGHAVALAPADAVGAILPVWRRAQDEAVALRRAGGAGAAAAEPAALALDTSLSHDGSDARTGGLPSPARSASGERERGFARAARLARTLGQRLRDEAASPAGPSIHLGLGSSSTNSLGSSPGLARAGAGAGAAAAAAAGIDLRDLQHGLGEEAERARESARRALVKGVGWLLGADESELG